MKNWIKKIFSESLEQHLRNEFAIQEQLIQQRSLIIKLGQQLEAIKEQLDSFATILSSMSTAQSSATENSAQPLATSRGSWPRMKKHFEERDVRGILEEANNHASNLEEYWKNKNLG